jgi:N-acetylglucosaminyl-diphospho-decaprenol L-rhamnosyltransferase
LIVSPATIAEIDSARLGRGGVDPTVLDIVIVSFECRDHLRDCLESLKQTIDDVPSNVFVVDNASTDGTVEMLVNDFPRVTAISSSENLGFAAASNLGIRRGSSPFVLLLNPDTRLVGRGLGRLIEVMNERPELGICGCRLVLEDGTLDHAAKRSFPTIAGSLGHFLRLGRTSWAPARLSQYRAPFVEVGVVDAVNGAFMLVRRAALTSVGLLDENYWMYMEDLDICYRFKAAGWNTWYEPSVSVVHIKGGSTGRVRPPRLNFAFHYGMFRFYRSHYAAERSPFVNGAVYCGIALKLGVSVVNAALRHAAQRMRRRRSPARSFSDVRR